MSKLPRLLKEGYWDYIKLICSFIAIENIRQNFKNERCVHQGPSIHFCIAAKARENERPDVDETFAIVGFDCCVLSIPQTR